MLVETSGEFERLFDRYDIRCAYVPAASRVSAGLVRAGWTPLFDDAVWTVLARDPAKTDVKMAGRGAS
jgi:hypothetical protein